MKRLITLLCSFALCMGVSAQEEVENPSKFQYVGVQGGVTNTFDNCFDTDRELSKYWSPTVSVSYGRFWNPIFGARVHVNGAWTKTGIASSLGASVPYTYNYITTNGDLLINLCNANRQRTDFPVNVLLALGLGANCAWETAGRAESVAATTGTIFRHADNDSRWAMNARAGLIFDVPINKHFSVNLETDLNYIETFTDKCFNSDNMQFTAQLGVNYRFGKKAKKVPVVREPAMVLVRDTIPFNETKYDTVTIDNTCSWIVTYEIRESDFVNAESQIEEIGRFLSQNKGCKIGVKSYADRETGNPNVNMQYSKLRAEKAYDVLKQTGVNPESITVEYFGDTVQPFAENDRNRCTIITVTGLKDDIRSNVVRSFRVEERMVQMPE